MKTKRIETIWEYSINTETERVLYTARGIANGFYQFNNFLVVPSNYPSTQTNLVTIPNLRYESMRNFWKKTSKLSPELPLNYPRTLTEPVKALLTSTFNPTIDYRTQQREWETIQSSILGVLDKLFPREMKKIKKLVIYPTYFGTKLSFSFPINSTIYLYLRHDHGPANIVWGIVSSLNRKKHFNNYLSTWSESQIIADWIIGETEINDLLEKNRIKKDYSALQETRRGYSKEAVEASKVFYKRHDIDWTANTIRAEHGEIIINGKPIKIFNPKEANVLFMLLANRGSAVDVYKIGEVFCGSCDKFSLYAISKSIQRLRDKLDKLGISGSLIQTVHGQGFMIR